MSPVVHLERHLRSLPPPRDPPTRPLASRPVGRERLPPGGAGWRHLHRSDCGSGSEALRPCRLDDPEPVRSGRFPGAYRMNGREWRIPPGAIAAFSGPSVSGMPGGAMRVLRAGHQAARALREAMAGVTKPDAAMDVLRDVLEQCHLPAPISWAALRSEVAPRHRGVSRGPIGEPPRMGAGWPEAPDIPGPPAPDRLALSARSPVVRAHVESVARATQTPPDLGALLAVASVSVAIGGRVEVAVDHRGWREPANIYAAAILPPPPESRPCTRR